MRLYAAVTEMAIAPQYYDQTRNAVAQLFLDACTRYDMPMVHALIEDRTVPVVQQYFAPHPLFIAAGRRNVALLELLLAAGFDANVRDASINGGTLLHSFALHSEESARWQDPLTAVIETQQDGTGALANSQQIDPQAGTPAQETGRATAENADLAMLRLTLQADAEINAVDDFGRTALMVALQYHSFGLAEALLAAGAAADVFDEHCKTAAFYASEVGAPEHICRLLPPFKFDCLAAHELAAQKASRGGKCLMWNAAADTKPQKDYFKKKAKKAVAPKKK